MLICAIYAIGIYAQGIYAIGIYAQGILRTAISTGTKNCVFVSRQNKPKQIKFVVSLRTYFKAGKNRLPDAQVFGAQP